MHLLHFSEDPTIACFEPRPVRVPSRRPAGQEWLNGPLVWAIAPAHARLYLFPRECPRIVVWPTKATTAADRQAWLGDLAPGVQAVAFVERDWLARIAGTTVYRYELPGAAFRDLDDAGMHVATQAVHPLAMHPVPNLCAALRTSGTELRAVEALRVLRPVWQSTLQASGIRLRNAAGWD